MAAGKTTRSRSKNTQASYQQLKTDIAEGNIAPVYLFLGEEDFLATKCIDALKKALLTEEETEWNLVQFEGRDVSGQEVYRFLNTLPFFGQKRLAVIKNADHLPDAEGEVLVSLMEAMPAHAHLIIVAPRLDKRTRFYRAAVANGRVIELPRLQRDQAAAWAVKRAAALGLSLDRRLALQLVNRTGTSLWQVDSELNKLASYKGDDSSPVTEAEINEVVSLTNQEVAEYAIFHFTDALAEGRRQEALQLLNRLLGVGREPLVILFMIARQFRLIAFAHEAMAGGPGQQEMAKELGVPPFVMKKAFSQAQRLGAAGIRRALSLTLQADREIKTGINSAQRALELLVLRLTNGRI